MACAIMASWDIMVHMEAGAHATCHGAPREYLRDHANRHAMILKKYALLARPLPDPTRYGIDQDSSLRLITRGGGRWRCDAKSYSNNA